MVLVLVLCRTRQICLLWVLPTRDLLPLLRRKPALYHKAVLQAVPSMPFDYLAVDPIAVGHPGGTVPHSPCKPWTLWASACVTGTACIPSKQSAGAESHGRICNVTLLEVTY